MELIENVHEKILDRIQERIDQLSPAISTLSLTHSELREMPGAIHIDEQEGQTPEQETTLLEDVEKPHWEQRAKEAEEQGKNKRAQVLRNVVDTVQLKADYIRLKNNQQPASEEVQSILEDKVNTSEKQKVGQGELTSPLNRCDRCCRCYNHHHSAGRKAIKTGAKATSKFTKSLAVGKKVAPLLGAV